MADNTKYYYMRLKENFFDSENMVLLESMPDGYLYSNILLKLYLRSLKGNGRLMLNERIPYNPQMIATLTRHQVGTIEKALKIFSELGLIEVLDSGAIYMLDIQNYIGKSSTEADRQRAYQAKIAKEKVSALPDNKSCKKSNKKSNLEIETEIEIELEQEIKEKKKSVQQSRTSEIEAEFETLWKMYPNKKGKDKALAAFIKARKSGTEFEVIEKGLKDYCTECHLKKTKKQYIKNGSTWFNQKCWLDEYDLTINNNGYTQAQNEVEQVIDSRFTL